MSEPVQAVAAALPEELAPLLARAATTRRGRSGPGWVYRGELAGEPVLLARTGEGAAAASRTLEALFAQHSVSRVLWIGICGGLSPGLRPGMLVAGARILDARGPAPAPDSEWLGAASRLDGVRAGTILSVDRILATAEAKRDAWRDLRLGDHPDPAVVDLESAAVARLAASHGLRSLVLRSVCDPAGETLPFDVDACAGDGGGVSRPRVVGYALRHPGIVVRLRELRSRVADASVRLAEVAEALLNPARPSRVMDDVRGTSSAGTGGEERV